MEVPSPRILLEQASTQSSLASQTRLYDSPWSDESSILSKVFVPEGAFFEWLWEMLPKAQREFLEISRIYWPKIYNQAFRRQWQLVNFGNAEQRAWQNAKYDYGDRPELMNKNKVTWTEFKRGLRRLRDARNVSCHATKMENRGSLGEMDAILAGVQYFFVTIGSRESADRLYARRIELRDMGEEAFKRVQGLRTFAWGEVEPIRSDNLGFTGLEGTEIIPPVFVVINDDTLIPAPFTRINDGTPKVKTEDPPTKTEAELFESQYDNISPYERHSLVGMLRWVTAKEYWDPSYQRKTPQQRAADDRVTPKLRALLAATRNVLSVREQLEEEAMIAEQNAFYAKKAQDAAQAARDEAKVPNTPTPVANDPDNPNIGARDLDIYEASDEENKHPRPPPTTRRRLFTDQTQPGVSTTPQEDRPLGTSPVAPWGTKRVQHEAQQKIRALGNDILEPAPTHYPKLKGAALRESLLGPDPARHGSFFVHIQPTQALSVKAEVLTTKSKRKFAAEESVESTKGGKKSRVANRVAAVEGVTRRITRQSWKKGYR